MNKTATCIALLTTLLLTACGEVEDTRPGKPVASRQAAFKQIVRAFEPMGVTLREGVYEPKGFARQAHQLAELKDGPWQYFGPDTNYPPTKATPAVWSEATRFADERERFLKAVSELENAAASENEARVRAAYEAVHARCKSCHKDFRVR